MRYRIDPLIYHIHRSQNIPDLPFWNLLASQCSGLVLELGCGSGIVTLALAESGHKVTGLDASFEMLAFFKQHIPPGLRATIDLIQGDFTCFHLAEKFSLIIMPCNTYSTLSSVERKQTLLQVGRHLLDEGIFAVQITNPSLLNDLPEVGESEIEDIFTDPVSGDPVQVSSSWIRTGDQLAVNWHYDRLTARGEVARSEISLTHSVVNPQTYRDEFTQAGFRIQNELGDYDFSPYTSQSPLLLALVTPSKR